MRYIHRGAFSLRSYLDAARRFWRSWLRPQRAFTGRERLRRLSQRRFIVPRLEGLEERVVPAAPVNSPADQVGNMVSGLMASEMSLLNQIQSSVIQAITQIEQGVNTAIFSTYQSLATGMANAIASLEKVNATFCPPCPSPPPSPPPPPPPGTNPPTANADSYTLNHDTTLSLSAANGVLANDTDPNNLPLSAALVAAPSHGALTFNNDGSFIYVPNPGFTGNDSFSYTASDGKATSNTATVSLTVQDNGTITTKPDSYSVPHDQALSINAGNGVLANDNDSDGDTLTATLVTAPSHGNLTFNSDGSFTYTPQPGYAGNDSFQYTAGDGIKSSAPTTVNINVTNTAPTTINHSYGVPKNTSVNVGAINGLFQGASDPDGDTLFLSSSTAPSNGTLQVNTDGSFTYAPNSGFTGNDSFQYTVSDGASTSTSTVTLNVHASNTAPVANADSYSVERNNTFSVAAAAGVLANDSDADGDPLTALLVTAPTNGSLTFNSDGSFRYTPTTNFTGTDTFTYEASDGVSTSPSATVTLTISGSPPTASDQNFAVLQNTTLNAPSGSLLLDAVNPDNMNLTAQDVTQPSNGAVVVNANGSFAYTPTTGFTGSDTFTYDLTDGGLTSSAATVTILVNSTDTAPTATDLSFTAIENNTLNVDLNNGVISAASDSDGDSLFAKLTSGPSNGTLTLNLDGSFSYTPNNNFTGSDSFQYQAFDGTSYSNTATVTLTVASNVPTANNDTYGVHPNKTLNVAGPGVLANDTTATNTPLSAVLVSGVTHGSLTLNSDGSFSYAPNSGFTGTDSFTYEANNGIANSNVATVTLNVNATNSVPTAADDSYSTAHNSPLTVVASSGVLANDSDSDNDPLTAVLVSSPSNGFLTLNGDGSFTYTPNKNFIGTDAFTYQANDGLSNSNTATVTITVTDNPPSAGDDSYSIAHDKTLTAPASTGVLANDTDPDGDPLTAQLSSGPSNGTLVFQSNGSFTYTPNAHFAGIDSFTYMANDGMMSSAPATVFLYVTNAIPVADNDSYSIGAGNVLSVAAPSGVLANDADSDGDTLTAQLVTGPSSGSLTLNSDGSFKYTPNAGFAGNDSFTYQATDGIAASNTATVTITVTQPRTVSNLPIANDDEYATGMNQSLTIGGPGVLGNDVAPSGQSLTAELNTGPSDGTLTLNPDGSFTYTPQANFVGDDSFTYFAAAGPLLSAAPARVVVHVTTISLTMPNGPWVPINANDDNGSLITNRIPQTRDFNFLRPLTRNDTQLQPLNITIRNPVPTGLVDLEVKQTTGSTGRIRMWSDLRKTMQIMPGIYPAMGRGALPTTIYVEGIEPTSRTITPGNAIAPAATDNTITATYFVQNPAIPPGILPLLPVGTSQVSVGVTPVVQLFTINNLPAPPNPQAGVVNQGRVGFNNGVDISNGYLTYSVNPAAANPNALLGPPAFGGVFNALAFRANMPGALHFIQNLTITNGTRGVANAWTYTAGGPAAQNFVWLINRRVVASTTALVDVANARTFPYYTLPPAVRNVPGFLARQAGANLTQIASADGPNINGPLLLTIGLNGFDPLVNARGGIVTRVAFTLGFTLDVVWSMPAGGGMAGDVIYTLATRPWSAVFDATSVPANGWANTLGAASGVFSPGDFTITHNDPVVSGPGANTVTRIQ